MPVTGVTYQSQIALNSGNTTPHGAVWIQELNRVWIANNSDDSRYIYNEAGTYQSKASLPTGNTAPRGFCFVASRDEVWSLDVSSLYRIDTDGTAQGSYALHANNRHGEGLLYFPSIDEVWVVDRVDRLWYRYRAADGTFIGTYPLNSANSDPRGAAFVDGEAWCLNGSDKKMYPYSASGVYRGTAISLDSRQSLPRALTRVKNDLWVLDNANDNIFKYTLVGLSMSIESIDEQFITLGTKTYDLVIDITGTPDKVEATGHMEGFYQDWDATNAQLHIKSAEVTRLISGVFWTVKATKGVETVTSTITYNVVKATPIFQTLAKLYLYKNVPINIDILIQNIPNLLLPNALLLGLKSDLKDYGVNIQGKLPKDANFSIDEGNFVFTVPSDTGGTPQVQNYAYEIESGTPPAIATPTFEPKGNYGALTFTDVTHALNYEWTLESGDDAAWNAFSSTRQVIDPGRIEVTPGHLNVTLKFPNITGASSYEYMLSSETHEVDWTPFVGTLSNQMITTIIPDLQEGVTYTLRLRVGSPWVGVPVSIQITGGRILYALHEDTSSNDDHVLYVFHSGTVQGAVASTIKRILIPDDVDTPRDLAIDFKNNNFYILDTQDYSIHVFPLNTANNTEAVRSRKFFKPSTLSSPLSLAFDDDTLYAGQNNIYKFESFLANTANGQTAVRINEYILGSAIRVGGNNRSYACDIDGESIYALVSASVGEYVVSFAKSPASFTNIPLALDERFASIDEDALSVVGNTGYVVRNDNEIELIDLTKPYKSDSSQRIRTFIAPPGCSRIRGLVAEK